MSRHLQDMLLKKAGYYNIAARGVVVDRWALRQREYCEGVVFNVALAETDVGTDGPGVAMLHFRDEVAVACSFLEKGDEVMVSSFVVEGNPGHNPYAQEDKNVPRSKALLATPTVLVCGHDATVTVLTKQQGEFLQLELKPGRYDAPEARLFTRKPTESRQKIVCNTHEGMGERLPE
eukprot:TRINITY_DN11974_c0_g2_i3.p1 TRINITY_DN11974_c0_g2~~TRINITY_DN11974_c0_g2_i3.p1  ORF type:complete len:177 (+),score=71.95 TRINITY_DN11974_c0_g2_i3:92-622(+)